MSDNDKLQNNDPSLPSQTDNAAYTSPTTIPLRIPVPDDAVPGIAASPPQFVTINEIMSTASALKDMTLVHNIVVDKDFKLTPFQPPENSIQKQLKDSLHQAFWDLLAEELHSDPPVYTRAMALLKEVKTELFGLLPFPQHQSLKQEIDEMIDIPFIEQQAENGALNFLGYAQFIINFMGRLCAPARDENIEELKKISDPVLVFKGVMETLKLMSIDFTNFEIEMLRSKLMNHCVDYEKNKFAEVVALQGGIESLTLTKKWLKRHFEKAPSSTERDVVLSAFLELFEWDEELFPETAAMDRWRITELSHRLLQLITSGTVLLVTLSRANWPLLQQSTAFKEQLLKDVAVLLQDVKDDESLKTVLPNVAVQVIEILKKHVEEVTKSSGVVPPLEVTSAFEQSLTDLLLEIHRSDHGVRRVVKQRTYEFLRVSISSAPNIPKQLPPGLTSLRSELFSVTASILKLYKLNLAVFSDYYYQIISKIKEESSVV